MTDETAATFMPPLTRIHDACAAFVAAYRTDDEDGNQVRRALAELRTALLRHREPHETEPQWRIGIEVPMRLPDEQRHTLFAAVADAVHDWEPEQRDGWDVNVYGCPAAEDTPDHFHRAPDEDEATVDRVAEAAFGAWHEGCSLMPADPAGAHWRRIARAFWSPPTQGVFADSDVAADAARRFAAGLHPGYHAVVVSRTVTRTEWRTVDSESSEDRRGDVSKPVVTCDNGSRKRG